MPPPTDRADRPALLQGTLDLLILRTLAHGSNHGYGIAKRIRETSQAVILVEEGTLYPALHRLEKRGSVVSAWERTDTNRRAKVYRLTPDGRSRLEAEQSAWRTMSRAIDRVIGDVPASFGAADLRSVTT